MRLTVYANLKRSCSRTMNLGYHIGAEYDQLLRLPNSRPLTSKMQKWALGWFQPEVISEMAASADPEPAGVLRRCAAPHLQRK